MTEQVNYSPGNKYQIFDIAQFVYHGIPRGRLFLSFTPGKESFRTQEDLQYIKNNGIQVIVCLLERWEMQTLQLSGYPRLAQEMGFLFYHIPIPDGKAPSQKELDLVVPTLMKHLSLGNNILVHCRGGYGRAGTLCACCLKFFGFHGSQAISYVRNKRPGAIQTPQQEKCVLQYCR